MLDDIIEAAIDILGEVLEAVITSRHKKKGRRKVKDSPEGEVAEVVTSSRRKKEKISPESDPWMRSTPDVLWEE